MRALRAPSSSEVIEESLKLLLALRHVCWTAYAAFYSRPKLALASGVSH